MENISLFLQLQQPHDQSETSANITSNPPPSPPPQPPHTAMLHSVKKPPAKPWRRPQPPPPKVYHVEPRGFRKLVQKLTGSMQRQQPEVETKIVRKFAPPPPPLALALRTLPPPPPSAFDFGDRTSTNSLGVEKGFIGLFLPSVCSPYSKWCSFPGLSPLSPGTMASLELSNNPIV